MHARVTSVSFPCVDLNKQGSRRPQKSKLKRTKVHAFFVPIKDELLSEQKETLIPKYNHYESKRFS